MKGFATVPDPSISIVHGMPLADEPGLGVLTLPGWFREVTHANGPREAIAQPRPGGAVERWSYDELWARALQVSRSLVDCGIGKGGRVGILMTNRAEFLAAFFGAALAGAVPTPLNTFSTQAELDRLLASSAISILILEPQVLTKNFLGMLQALAPEITGALPGGISSTRYPFLRHAVMLDSQESIGGFETWADFLARGSAVNVQQVQARAASVTPADPGALFFSSGTTGKAKGILNSQRGIAIQLWRWPRIWGIEDHDVRCWCANGFFWSGPIGMAFGGALSRGGTLVLQSTFQAEQALALFESERVTSPFAWPHQWAQLEGAANWASVDLSAMRHVAAENPLARHPTVHTHWQEPTRIYGNTETFTLSTGYCSGTSEAVLNGAHGFPLPGMTIKVVDPFTGKVMPVGGRGELAVKGATLMLGYIGVPLDETLDEQGFFRTGDGGYVDQEGRVYWEGRLNDIIKTGGANVSPREVDELLATFPGVKVNKTVGVPHETLGEMVVSCVVPHAGVELQEAQIRDFLKQQLASYKVPRRVLVMCEHELSFTGSAKVRSSALRELAARRIVQDATAR
jgi:fatty-acyl-CoA synthase